jgi:ribonuclease P protein component
MSGPDSLQTVETRRLQKRREFTFVRDGRTERRKSLVVQARARAGEAPGSHTGVGFTATKKIGGAVQRNRAKRRLREAARRLLPRLGLPGWDYVFIAREATGEAGWSRLLDDMESALLSLART